MKDNETNDFFDIEELNNGISEQDVDIAMGNFINTITAPTIEPKPDFWETDIEVIESCGVAPKSIQVSLEPLVVGKIDALMNKYTRMEWLAYLVGDKETNNITDIVIPEQIVTPVNVFVQDHVEGAIIGVIHSHHDMGNNFSHTDDEYINANHDISLCVSKSGINGQVRVKTECNRYILANADVIQWNGGLDVDDFLKDADALITVKTYTVKKRKKEEPIQQALIESKNIIKYVSQYHALIKSIETSDEGFIQDDKVEIGFLVSLLRSVNTADFYDIEDTMFDDDMGLKLCAECLELVDELDIFNDSLSNMDYIEIARLLKYLEDLVQEWNSPL